MACKFVQKVVPPEWRARYGLGLRASWRSDASERQGAANMKFDKTRKYDGTERLGCSTKETYMDGKRTDGVGII